MDLVITMHAQERMDQHGITREQVKVAVQRGAKVSQTDGLLATYGYIGVAFKIVEEKVIVKTVMIQR